MATMTAQPVERYPNLDNVVHADVAREIRNLYRMVYTLQAALQVAQDELKALKPKGA